MRRTSVVTATGLEGLRVTRVESSLIRLFRVVDVEPREEDQVQEQYTIWQERFSVCRDRIARRLAVIDSQLGLGDRGPELSIAGRH
ncbi:MAG: hypothetical protein QF363_00065 [Planctomycetaceae bacterium]|nr:hypothetical protein [Planctomycetaceae bacterium]